jgi:hypothetical protein
MCTYFNKLIFLQRESTPIYTRWLSNCYVDIHIVQPDTRALHKMAKAPNGTRSLLVLIIICGLLIKTSRHLGLQKSTGRQSKTLTLSFPHHLSKFHRPKNSETFIVLLQSLPCWQKPPLFHSYYCLVDRTMEVNQISRAVAGAFYTPIAPPTSQETDANHAPGSLLPIITLLPSRETTDI